MVWQLVPLHAPGDLPVALPCDGTAGVGRRPSNFVVCQDLAVSGQHCLLHLGLIAEKEANEDALPEVEDCSTNGTYVNELKLNKGERCRLKLGDILSLTKPPEEDLAGAPPRVQFRLEWQPMQQQKPSPTSVGLAASTKAAEVAAERPTGVDPPAITSDGKCAQSPAPAAVPPAATSEASWAPGDHNFAQDLLVQEQQAKAKLTADLLYSQRKLDEERQASELAAQELQKLRRQVEEERARRQEAEQGRDRLGAEAELLRAERRQLQELEAAHTELEQRNEQADQELQARQRRCAQLESAQEQLRRETQAAVEAHQAASQQHAELSTRARQAQEKAERLEQQLTEAQRDAERWSEDVARLQRELKEEITAREQLQEQVNTTREQVSEAEVGERKAREALEVQLAKRAELECQASAAQTKAEGARANARQAQQRLASTARMVDRLQQGGKSVSAVLRRQAEIWDKAVGDFSFEGLGDALASLEGPTFEQVTCRAEETPTRSQHRVGDENADSVTGGAVAAAVGRGEVAGTSGVAPAKVGQPETQCKDAPQQMDAQPQEGHLTGLVSPERAAPKEEDRGLTEERPSATKPGVHSIGGESLGHVIADRDLLDAGATVADPNGCATATAATIAGIGPMACSTAWSLEVLEVGDDAAPNPKRHKASPM